MDKLKQRAHEIKENVSENLLQLRKEADQVQRETQEIKGKKLTEHDKQELIEITVG